MPNNVIEVLLRARDQASATVRAAGKNIEQTVKRIHQSSAETARVVQRTTAQTVDTIGRTVANSSAVVAPAARRMTADVNTALRNVSTRFASAGNRIADSASRIGTSLFNLRNAIIATFAAFLGRQVIQASDGLTLIQSKLRLVTESNAELAVTQERLIALAQRARTQLSSTVELYSRVARSSEQLNATQSELLQFTESVSQAIQISGNTAQEASAGVIQLAQALASGTLRGDELRSVLEQMPRVATAIADGLGTTIGQLRALGAAGKLTSEQVFDALLSQSGKLREEFAKLTPTIGQSFTQLFNALTVATAEFVGATGGAKSFSGAISGLSEIILRNRADFVEWGAFIKRVISELVLAFSNFVENAKGRLAQLQGVFLRIQFLLRPAQAGLLLDAAREAEKTAAGILGREAERYERAAKDIETTFDNALRTADELRNRIRNQQTEGAPTLSSGGGGSGEGPLIFPEPFDLGQAAAGEQRRRIIDLLDSGIADGVKESQENINRQFDDLYPPLIDKTKETSEIINGIWQGVGQSMQRTLSDAIFNADFSLRSLVDIFRRAFADIASALITSGLQKQLAGLFSFVGGGGGGVIDTGFAIFGTKAGGGNFDGPQIVGEDGPEVVTGRGRVFNRRQLAFAGAGAPVNFSPVTNISIIERENPNQTKQEIFQAVALENAKQQAEFVRTLRRSGVEVKG